MTERVRSELAIWRELSGRAEEYFGRDGAAALRADIESLVAELHAIEAFPLRPDDEA